MALEDSFLNEQFKWWGENPCYSAFCSESLDISPVSSWCLLQYEFTPGLPSVTICMAFGFVD